MNTNIDSFVNIKANIISANGLNKTKNNSIKQDAILIDESCNEKLCCTFWDENAEILTSEHRKTVIIGAKVREYNGQRQLTVTKNSRVKLF